VLFLPLLILDGLPIRDYARVLTPTALLLPVLAGQAVAVLPRAVAPRTGTVFARVLTGVFVGGSVATVLPWVPDLYRDEVEPWNSVCARIAGEEQPGDVVLVSADFMTQPLGYCFAGRSPVHGFRDPGGALQRAQERPRAWVLYSHAWKPADADVQQLGVRALVSHGFVVREYWQPGPLIELYLLERRQAAAGIPSG